MYTMRASLALLIPAVLFGQQRPLDLDDIGGLLAAGVDAPALTATAKKRGVSVPGTPAVRKWLRAAGAMDPHLAALFPDEAPPEQTMLAPARLGFAVPEGWKANRTDRTWALEPPDGAPSGFELILRVTRWTPDPRVTVLQDLLQLRITPYLEDHGYRITSQGPVPAPGITGVEARLLRSRVGERPVFVRLALFQHREWTVSVRLAVAGAHTDPFVTRAHTAGQAVITSISPDGPRPEGDKRTRYAVTAVTPDGNRLLLVDRAGSVLRDIDPEPRTVCGDPLGSVHLVRPVGPTLMVSRSGRVPDATDIGIDHAPLADPEEHFVPHADMGKTGGAMVRLLGLGRETRPVERTFRLVHHLEAIADPGSDWLLCAMDANHLPLPQTSQKAQASGVLAYVGKDGQGFRPLLRCMSPGLDHVVLRHPRFSPSGREVLCIHHRQGLCILPRDGGLPVVLHPGRVLGAEPWIAPR